MPYAHTDRNYSISADLHRARFNLLPPSDQMPSSYGFVEYSHRTTNLPGLSGDRIFAGMLLQY